MLPPTDKKHEEKIYNVPTNVLNQITSLGTIFQISSQGEASDYYINYMKHNKLWKVVMETFHKDNKSYRI